MGVLRAENLSKSYSGKIALSQVDFEIPKDRITGLLGRNGAGKTTALRLLTGILEPDSGSVHWNQVPIKEQLAEFKMNLGYLPEEAPVYPDMTVSESLDFFAKARGIEGEALKRRKKEVLEICDLRSDLHRLSGILSRGTRQRLALACALVHDPEILILDEPSSGLDPLQISHFRETIRKIAKNKILLLSSHILSEVEELCDHAFVLQNGRLVADQSISEFRKKDSVLLRAKTDLETLRGFFSGTDVIVSQANSSGEFPEFRLDSSLLDPATIFEIVRRSPFQVLEYKVSRSSLESALQELIR